MDRKMSADVTASVANDAARLPAGSVIIVDDFHLAAAATAAQMTDLVERWPARPSSWCWPVVLTLPCGSTGCACRAS